MKKSITFIGEVPVVNNHAGNKARADVDTILREKYGLPYESLEEIKFSGFFQKVRYLLNPSNLNQILRICRLCSQYVIIQYPIYFNPLVKMALLFFLRKNKVVFLIHDINALRIFKNADMDIKKEIKELNMTQAVIVHNEIMGVALQKLGLKVPWFSLELFDYLLPFAPKKQLSIGKNIAFAGNLGKSLFLRKPDMEELQLQFYLYGPGYSEDLFQWKNVDFRGSFLPDEIPYELEGNFGLIWDGPDINTCGGTTGGYMKYNNPHKLSLYIAAGMPVIVWNQAAIASFVKNNGIGFAVSSLKEISGKIETYTEADYENMQENIKNLQKLVVNGYFTKHCLKKIEDVLFN